MGHQDTAGAHLHVISHKIWNQLRDTDKGHYLIQLRCQNQFFRCLPLHSCMLIVNDHKIKAHGPGNVQYSSIPQIVKKSHRRFSCTDLFQKRIFFK